MNKVHPPTRVASTVLSSRALCSAALQLHVVCTVAACGLDPWPDPQPPSPVACQSKVPSSCTAYLALRNHATGKVRTVFGQDAAMGLWPPGAEDAKGAVVLEFEADVQPCCPGEVSIANVSLVSIGARTGSWRCVALHSGAPCSSAVDWPELRAPLHASQREADRARLEVAFADKPYEPSSARLCVDVIDLARSPEPKQRCVWLAASLSDEPMRLEPAGPYDMRHWKPGTALTTELRAHLTGGSRGLVLSASWAGPPLAMLRVGTNYVTVGAAGLPFDPPLEVVSNYDELLPFRHDGPDKVGAAGGSLVLQTSAGPLKHPVRFKDDSANQPEDCLLPRKAGPMTVEAPVRGGAAPRTCISTTPVCRRSGSTPFG
ncbi:MAG: hypothetical protein FJ100_15435 [Deltaproteobacteria bacterium]|nr:hypothetical protein [Deltaproteobacteria bacterium]